MFSRFKIALNYSALRKCHAWEVGDEVRLSELLNWHVVAVHVKNSVYHSSYPGREEEEVVRMTFHQKPDSLERLLALRSIQVDLNNPSTL